MCIIRAVQHPSTSTAIALLKFATDDDDAALRAAHWDKEDPLPSVPCALLSSAEIYDYARITGMLFPFYPELLKSASYEVFLGGEVISWDDQHQKHSRRISRGEQLKLQPNSITFVQVEPIFRLPSYIAIRFNLRITHVHRGLLLGTGPLVDPGFGGKLLIPLHNLTASPYDIDTNKALIWIEFTKTTFFIKPKEEIASPTCHFYPFPESNKYLTAENYLYKANAGNPILSSIPDAIQQGRQSAERAERTVTRIGNLLAGVGGLAAATLTIGLLAVYLQVVGLVQNSDALSTSVAQGFAPLATDEKGIIQKLAVAQEEIVQLRRRLDELDIELDKLKPPSAPLQPREQHP